MNVYMQMENNRMSFVSHAYFFCIFCTNHMFKAPNKGETKARNTNSNVVIPISFMANSTPHWDIVEIPSV